MVTSPSRPSTLYLTKNGLLEPLGQSQVLAYVKGLASEYAITLITYEKDEDWSDKPRVLKLSDECRRLGVDWQPQRFRRKPKLLAPLGNLLSMLGLAWRLVGQKNILLIHARSYIPATVALLMHRLKGVPFIFDMRALWPEELITAGRLRRGSLLHSAIVFAERRCLAQAAAVVSLTHAAVDYLKQTYPNETQRQTIRVIPTCADLERFCPTSAAPSATRIGCLGTVLSGWFRLDWLSAFIQVASDEDNSVSFEVTTRDDPIEVLARLDPTDNYRDRLRIAASASDRVHEVLQGQTASVMFYAGGEVSELGRSPTRMAEILGCGLPVVANEGVGDVALIIRQYRVGVLAEGCTREHMQKAWYELKSLLSEPGLAVRCRAAAEAVYSLDTGRQAYSQLYSEILGRTK